ncbi:MAG: hypothetical protein KJZ96_17445 [Rhodocyclaceae bacterium]|jgi:hypothetical protein|nr:hypothetical protein [Rhodocyclaceae bacterium]MCL4760123.1 hypothetical protein [Rhodocyclaceae bacterium]
MNKKAMESTPFIRKTAPTLDLRASRPPEAGFACLRTGEQTSRKEGATSAISALHVRHGPKP